MRSGISFIVSAGDRQRLRAIVADPKSLQKHVWRARIVLLSGEGLGTSAIMADTGKSKTCVWRWQERFMHEGVRETGACAQHQPCRGGQNGPQWPRAADRWSRRDGGGPASAAAGRERIGDRRGHRMAARRGPRLPLGRPAAGSRGGVRRRAEVPRRGSHRGIERPRMVRRVDPNSPISRTPESRVVKTTAIQPATGRLW